MAIDFGNIQQGMLEGYKTGYATGGKLSGIGAALAKWNADEQARQQAQAQGQRATQLLGVQGLMEGKLQPAQNNAPGSFSVSGLVDNQGKSIYLTSNSEFPNLSESTLESIPEGVTMNYRTPHGTISLKNPNSQINALDRMETKITDKVMNSQPGSVDYETAKDMAFGKMSINEFNHFVGGLGQQSRFKGQAMLQLAKKINPNFNETMLENSQAGLRSRITTLDRQAGLISQIANRVDKFGDIALQYSDKVSRGNYPLKNKIDFLWNTNVNQNPTIAPDVKAFVDSVKLLSVDWARATTNQTGGAAVSDAARKEFGELISATDSPETFKSLVNLARKDTAASKQGYVDASKQAYQQYQEDYGDIGNVGNSPFQVGQMYNGHKILSVEKI